MYRAQHLRVIQRYVAFNSVHCTRTCSMRPDHSFNVHGAMYVRLQILISNTSREHRCILSRKYFPIASVDREKSEYHNVLWHLH